MGEASSSQYGSMVSDSDVTVTGQRERKLLQLALLTKGSAEKDGQQIGGTPIFTQKVLETAPKAFTQYGFLAGNAELLDGMTTQDLMSATDDPRLYFNVAAPSSVFICGSQGSGKSHTLSCLLESCLLKSNASEIVTPLTGLVFHYDTFSSDEGGSPCEAAYVGKDSKVKVRVFCAPTNIATIRRNYAGLDASVEPLIIDQKHLNTQRMLDLMAVNPDNGPMPLYLHAINTILRKMRLDDQKNGGSAPFNYKEFKRLVDDCKMTPAQLMPLQQRLDTLESFMHLEKPKVPNGKSKEKQYQKALDGNDWTLKSGTLTIVDLSCPCVTAEAACALFNICLGVFMTQKEKIGRVIALDEAHKYMTSAPEAATLTESLLSAIRLQRHLGTRIFISTQEPTISPKLLDLCSVTIVHRFTSPEWLRCLRAHLAALDDATASGKAELKRILHEIVQLRVGEALMFAPSASIDGEDADGKYQIKRLGMDYLRVQVRSRVTKDGGKTQMAS